jgi:hypothetical protein
VTGVKIIQRAAGTYTLVVIRDDVTIHRTAGIETKEEAVRRARVWRDMCGYKIAAR